MVNYYQLTNLDLLLLTLPLLPYLRQLIVGYGNVNSVVFLELKKAFDTVDHTLRLSKLDCYVYGITGPEGEWFRSYLSSRTQSCMVRGCIN